MLMPDFPLEPKKMIALGFAFETACEELGIGDGSLEVAKRERVSQFILRQVLQGEHTLTRSTAGRSSISETQPRLCDEALGMMVDQSAVGYVLAGLALAATGVLYWRAGRVSP